MKRTSKSAKNADLDVLKLHAEECKDTHSSSEIYAVEGGMSVSVNAEE